MVWFSLMTWFFFGTITFWEENVVKKNLLEWLSKPKSFIKTTFIPITFDKLENLQQAWPLSLKLKSSITEATDVIGQKF